VPILAARGVLTGVLCAAITILTILLLVKVLVSWALVFGFRPPITGPVRWFLDLLDDVTEPLLRPLRRLMPPVRAGGVGLDLSVIVAFVILAVLRIALNC
jgi:YggT family protein